MPSMKHFATSYNARNKEREQKLREERVEAAKIGDRIRELKGLVHDVFPYQVYHQAKPRVRQLGQDGGPEYREAVRLVKHIQWFRNIEKKISEVDWDEAVNFVTR